MPIIRKWAHEFLKQRKSPIFVRHYQIMGCKRPLDRKVRVIPTDSTILRWAVIIGYLVQHHGIIL